ncbi:MAG: hypothetical protein M1608_17785 [Candidatus Omnitrophica bacterium]|nr:hypothetical protein [Candidatus Omnitrophota bacterium]
MSTPCCCSALTSSCDPFRLAITCTNEPAQAAAEGTDLPAAGKGALDYPLYLQLLAGLNREIYLALEHLTLDDVPRARDYVQAQFDKLD